MAVLSKGNLFPPELVNGMFKQVKGESSLAKLSEAKPVAFDGETEFVFNLDGTFDGGASPAHGKVPWLWSHRYLPFHLFLWIQGLCSPV